jgi:nucleotide-binding universal stress UspA family protein
LSDCPLPQNATITVMHVLPPEMTMEMLIRSWPYGIDALPPILSSEIDQSLEDRAKEEVQAGEALVKNTVQELSHLGFTANEVLRRGDAATEILNYAEENQIDLIIAGSRGLSQFRSWLLGSVSNKLTHYADCSVLIVKKAGENLA